MIASNHLVVVDKTSIDVYRHLEKSMKLHFWKKWHGTASKVLGIEGRLFFVFWSTPVREIATFAKVHFSVSFSNGEDRCKKSSELQLQANWPRSKHFDIFTTFFIFQIHIWYCDRHSSFVSYFYLCYGGWRHGHNKTYIIDLLCKTPEKFMCRNIFYF